MTHSLKTNDITHTQSATTNGIGLFDLGYLKIATVSGDDATHFLQGQLSNDINLLNDNSPHQLSAYCTPKGRVLANFDLFKLDEGYALVAPEAVLNKVLPRLRMFVMRSAVKIELSASSELTGLQIFGEYQQAYLTELLNMGVKYYHHNNDPQRFFVIADQSTTVSIRKQRDELTLFTEKDWQLINIKQNLPEIFEQTVEAFIPQSINLDLVNGVNFKKGCYPGQEIIARVKYRGKPKTRMIAACADKNQSIEIAGPVFIDGRDSPAGMVCQRVFENDQMWMSLSVPVTHLHQGALYLDQARSVKIERLPFAYEITA